jgi:hypothetical protein
MTLRFIYIIYRKPFLKTLLSILIILDQPILFARVFLLATRVFKSLLRVLVLLLISITAIALLTDFPLLILV